MIVPEISRSMLKNATVLGLFAIVTVGAVTLLQQGTAERIQAAERAARYVRWARSSRLAAMTTICSMTACWFRIACLATEAHCPPISPSRMDVLRSDPPGHRSGRLQRRHSSAGGHPCRRPGGWRASHRPPGNTGLGDKIEARKEPPIRSFDGKSLTNPAADGWAVKKDRGEFDQFAGATITPRAVVGAVHRALQYFDAHKAELLAAEGATADATGNAPEGRSEPDEATVHSRAGSAATRDELRTTEPAAKPQRDQP